ncbi:MAG: excinuclease ABC subunit UvrB, partial [Kiritimatiellia bacterium]|nr:excinuclease ABC subunit UvrB [Kiritimatiellia bacterium]
QLYSELKSFFPDNAVEYFVSYYDYYQPEAYIPTTDTYIEKDSAINEAIERMRLSATDALLNRPDVVLIASVSCIYGLGSPDDYRQMVVSLKQGGAADRDAVLRKLVDIQYSRNDAQTAPGTFRVRGDVLDIFPAYSESGIRISFFGDTVEKIQRIDPLTGKAFATTGSILISPARHFVLPIEKIESALQTIRDELEERVRWFEQHGKLLEAQRVRMRTEYDLDMLREIGFCSGIENYSRPLAGRAPGERPATLLDYFPGPFLTIVDESHVTLPQIRGMFNGDRARKSVLVDHGFRLPSALDNRPLNFEEFLSVTGPMLFASATPGPFERSVCPTPVSQIIRPTGIADPPVEVRPLQGQIDDLIGEVRRAAERGERVLACTLTKKTAEDLAAYLTETGLRVSYLHSEIDTVERVEILRSLRRADVDCVVGINLLREGLDLPEVALVAILDADKEGFLRSESALVQTAGRAARHLDGRVILYADQITDSMRRMLEVTRARRETQLTYNREHGVTPTRIRRGLQESLQAEEQAEKINEAVVREGGEDYGTHEQIQALEREMLAAANALEFERAALLRDRIREWKEGRAPESPERSAQSRHASKRKGPNLYTRRSVRGGGRQGSRNA